MSWSAFSAWLGTPFRAMNAWFPFSFNGRQTLIYLVFAGAGPALTLLVWWAMREALKVQQFTEFASLANMVALCLLITVIGLAMFVSLRSLKIGPDGIEAERDATAAAKLNGAGQQNG